jgi:hypothetical protein
MSTLDELERRIAAIERRLGHEPAATWSLADMARTLRAQQQTFQTLASTEAQHTERLDRHDTSLTAAHRKLDRIITMLLDGRQERPSHSAARFT